MVQQLSPMVRPYCSASEAMKKGDEMPTTPRNRLPLRTHVSALIYDRINNRRCLHRDLWLVQDEDDILFIIVEERAAGQELLNRVIYRVVGRAPNLELLRHVGPEPRNAIQRQINSPWALKQYGNALVQLHDRAIQPALRQRPERMPLPPSVVCWYVWIDPTLSEPTDGVHNYYEGSAREAAGDRRSKRPRQIDGRYIGPPADQPKLSARDRSVLRTLDKLLK